MKQIETFSEVVELWPNFLKMAKALGTGRETVKSWHRRNRIPSSWWGALLRQHRVKLIGLTAEKLVQMADRKQNEHT